ncbi:gp239 [Bacillus phage W.Ph.]|uniref:Gp239 n=1 Tax=Bacillus phage W.Ph. TaxID=764595 RepID=G9B1Z0_9CAUD|nr:gp239 [Bacillus phage W.Ph.]ADH03385.1 gp239 [Bacillus phage W.Ph.]
MTRHARYKQLGKCTIKKGTINSVMLRTPTIEDNVFVFKNIGILSKTNRKVRP